MNCRDAGMQAGQMQGLWGGAGCGGRMVDCDCIRATDLGALLDQWSFSPAFPKPLFQLFDWLNYLVFRRSNQVCLTKKKSAGMQLSRYARSRKLHATFSVSLHQ